MRQGTLYAVGIGPGDPELMTLKAARLIRENKYICVPRGSESGVSMARGIVEQAVDLSDKQVLDVHFPMRKGTQRDSLVDAAGELLAILSGGDNVVFATLGDPVLYSTFFHLLDAVISINPGVRVELVPGVTSVTASGARLGINLALAKDKVAVLPATYMDDIRDTLDRFDTVVLMKVHSVMDELRRTLAETGHLERAYFVSRVGFPEEVALPLKDVRPEHINYFSTIIVRTANG